MDSELHEALSRNNSSNSLNEIIESKDLVTSTTVSSCFHTVTLSRSSIADNSNNSSVKVVKLVSLSQNDAKSPFYLSGFCRITLLKGKLQLNGHSFTIGKQIVIKNPVWMPACRAFVASSSQSNRNFDQLLQGHCSESQDKFSSCTSVLSSSHVCVFLFEGISLDEQEWMIAAEDQTLFSQDNVLKRLSIGKTKEEQDFLHQQSLQGLNQVCSLCSVNTAVIGNLDHMISLGLEIMNLDSSWIKAVDAVVKAVNNPSTRNLTYNNNNNNNISSNGNGGVMNDVHEKQFIKTVICGAKGVGKSSCLRYAVNSLLSQGKAVDAMCVIDCDIGQPELSVPGLISLQIVCNPILQAVHYNMHSSHHLSASCASTSVPSSSAAVAARQKAIKDNIREGRNQVISSYYIGDLTNKHDPDLLVACLRKLIEEYTTIANEYEALEGSVKPSSSSSSINKLSKKNSSDKLSTTSSGRGGGGGGSSNSKFDILRELEEESQSKKRKQVSGKVLPLLVNTDGFIRSMGAEILFNVLSLVKPSHIFQFSTDKDPLLSSVERYKALLIEESQPLLEQLQQQTDVPEQDDTNNDIFLSVVCGCDIQILKAGRTSTAKVDAIDLRTLRLVSYFLGGLSDPYNIKSKVRGVINNNNNNNNNNNGSGGLYIRNGTIVDLEGTLAVTLLKLTTLIVPFDKVAVQSINGVSVSKLLSALNGCIVGLVHIPTSNNTSGDNDESGLSTVQHKLQLRTNANTNDNNNNATNNVDSRSNTIVLHSVPLIPGAKLFPCVGLALIKCIDLTQQYFGVTTPLTTSHRVIEVINSSSNSSTNSSNTSLLSHAAMYGVSQSPLIHLSIVKGESSLQLPNCLLYAHGMPSYPYLSSESAGEGSAKMKARNNVKRRGQAK